MRAVVQRVLRARVTVAEESVGAIAQGLCVLVGIASGDTTGDAESLAEKVVGLRIFEDAEARMNKSLLDTGGELLAVSQFTLLGDARRGRRPSFAQAMEPFEAQRLFDAFCVACRRHGSTVHTGRFRAHMQVELVNDGPVTVLLDTTRLF